MGVGGATEKIGMIQQVIEFADLVSHG